MFYSKQLNNSILIICSDSLRNFSLQYFVIILLPRLYASRILCFTNMYKQHALHTCVHTHTQHTHIGVYTYRHKDTHTGIKTHIQTHAHTCISIPAHIYTNTHIPIHTYTHALSCTLYLPNYHR